MLVQLQVPFLQLLDLIGRDRRERKKETRGWEAMIKTSDGGSAPAACPEQTGQCLVEWAHINPPNKQTAKLG